MAVRVKKPREGDLVRAVMKFLRDTGWKVWRNNTGAVRKEGKGEAQSVRSGTRTFRVAGKKSRLVRFGKVGSGDVFALRRGAFLSVECKMPGNSPTPDQRLWMDDVNAHGGHAFVVRSVDDLVLALTGLSARGK
jgi:hypothetical protein